MSDVTAGQSKRRKVTLDGNEAAAYVAARFRCKNPSIVEVKRGLIPGDTGKVAHKVTDSADKLAHGVGRRVTQRVPDAPQELSLVH
jgi:hypothetical protein